LAKGEMGFSPGGCPDRVSHPGRRGTRPVKR